MFYIAFWFVVIVALCHLFWHGVLGPAVRIRKRMRLFAIRDEIRFKKLMANRNGEDNSDLIRLEEFVNNGIYLIHHFGLIDFILAKPENSSRVQPLDPELDSLRRRTVDHVMTCLFVNSVPMLVYLIPLAMTYRASKSLTNLLARPERELAQIFPYNHCHG